MAVIEAIGLRKMFGTTAALDGLDLTVTQGEVHGFLGPNGAGKSTTLRILLGLLRATGGTSTLFGHDPWRDAVSLHRRLAYVPGDVTVWPNLTGGEIIDLLLALRGGRTEIARTQSRRAQLLTDFDLDPGKKGRSYSKGNRQKIALIAALALDPELLLLDEPTAGLDPLMEQVFQAELVRTRDQGRTVLLSSHILSEVEKACTVVTIVRAGRVVESGSLADLRHLSATHVSARLADGRVVDAHVPPAEVAAWVAARGPGVQAVTATPPTLEELFLARYGDTAEAPTAADEAAAPTGRRGRRR